jgi:hypothetical protein
MGAAGSLGRAAWLFEGDGLSLSYSRVAGKAPAWARFTWAAL